MTDAKHNVTILSLCEENRRVGEDLLETARRLLIEEAMSLCAEQKTAGRILGLSERAICYHVGQYPHLWSKKRREREGVL